MRKELECCCCCWWLEESQGAGVQANSEMSESKHDSQTKGTKSQLIT